MSLTNPTPQQIERERRFSDQFFAATEGRNDKRREAIEEEVERALEGQRNLLKDYIETIAEKYGCDQCDGININGYRRLLEALTPNK